MTRYRGLIGINKGVIQTDSPGIVRPDIQEVEVSGDMYTTRVSWQYGGARERISLQNVLSIITPETSDVDFNEVVYVEWQNRKWSVTAIQYKRPRVELTMGGLYNG